ncbi:adenine phosphoribosyltransferase [Mesoterricola sediminis]|uniref:Adenine phosphoribosyltransferase n=1 Tax=Mesoterricola sediminis TaxID=2927980 RepID=A0AA48H1R3_9BACT|nr:adenine phosphoribosyltransferase [Mesoterricola sediminis]BDU78032.1 adenine phosphoribosyltransferase [Mesoterricola sediminis]
MNLKTSVLDVPGFPREGLHFKDITPLFSDAAAFARAIEAMAEPVLPLHPTHVLGLESRGFIFGSALAHKLGLGFVPARRAGKLPRPVLRETFATVCGEEGLEIHQDALQAGDRVLIVDDILASGATAAAARNLVERAGAHPLALTTFIEMVGAGGREALKGMPVFSVLTY